MMFSSVLTVILPGARLVILPCNVKSFWVAERAVVDGETVKGASGACGVNSKLVVEMAMRSGVMATPWVEIPWVFYRVPGRKSLPCLNSTSEIFVKPWGDNEPM